MVRINVTLEGMKRCPQCGIAHPSLMLESYFTNPLSTKNEDWAWFSYRCTSCDDIVAAKGKCYIGNLKGGAATYLHNWHVEAVQIVPEAGGLDDDLPDRPKSYLSQAIGSLGAPDGAVMLAGSAVDAMLKAKGLHSGSVYDRIEEAVTKAILTRDMAEWAHAVRLGSNRPRHADLDDPNASVEEARAAIEFTKALGDFLFVFPKRIERGRAAAEVA